MNESDLLARIEVRPDVLTGKPVIRGTRLSVQYVLGLLAKGWSTSDVVEEYPGLTPSDVHACLLFGARALAEVDFMPLTEPVV
jgi:uncharacterized protein (DUF433 family)